MIKGVRWSYRGWHRAELPPQFRFGRKSFRRSFHLPPSAILTAGTGAFVINPTTAGFGSFAPGSAQARSYITNSNGQYLISGLTVTLDTVEGAAEVRDFDVPVDFTRVAVVEGISVANGVNTAQVYQAILNIIVGLGGGPHRKFPVVAKVGNSSVGLHAEMSL